MMQCHEFEEVLEQSEAHQLPGDAAAHLNDCRQCRTLVEDLNAIQAAARELAAEEPAPPERVWLSLRSQLEAEGLIRVAEPARQSFRWFTGWLNLLPGPALAGIYLSLLLGAAVLISTRGNFWQTPTTPSGTAIAALNSQLNTVERHTVSALHQRDPAVTASLRQNLDVVDNFIGLCEKSVREEPQSELAREYLYGAYQQKAELLAMMMDRDQTGD
jgi:hypothetical protein